MVSRIYCPEPQKCRFMR
uniref:Uncharacterized protein n=1 Tax=Arundo donax TaxID=35708 RepID=A0A0A9U663_ARUDO